MSSGMSLDEALRTVAGGNGRYRAICDTPRSMGIADGVDFALEAIRKLMAGEPLYTPEGEV